MSRLESDYLLWRQREQHHINVFGADVLKRKRFIKEKLSYFEVLEAKYKQPGNLDDRLTLAIIRDERKELEQQLFPGLLTRTVYRLVKAAFAGRLEARYLQADQNKLNHLGEQLMTRGFRNPMAEIQKQIDKGLNEFSIPVTHHFKENEQVDFKLDIKRNANDGYYLADCRARLKKGDGQFTGFISLTKNDLDQISVGQAYNLLSGRSVASGSNWLQLDFNDKDAAGNYRTKVLPPSFGFELDTLLNNLKAKELADPIQKEQILSGLKNGDSVGITIAGPTGKTWICADACKKVLAKSVDDKQGTKVVQLTAGKNVVKASKGIKTPR